MEPGIEPGLGGWAHSNYLCGRTISSAGQSYRLITDWSGVQIPDGAPHTTMCQGDVEVKALHPIRREGRAPNEGTTSVEEVNKKTQNRVHFIVCPILWYKGLGW